MFSKWEGEAPKMGSHKTLYKRKMVTFNQDTYADIITVNGGMIEVVGNFKYLGWNINIINSNTKIYKSLVWRACQNMKNVWRYAIKRKLKINLFTTTVKLLLLYGSSAWTLTKNMGKLLENVHTYCKNDTQYQLKWAQN